LMICRESIQKHQLLSTRKRWEGIKMLLRDMPERSLSDLVDFCIKKERYDFLNSVFDDFPLDVQKKLHKCHHPKTPSQKPSQSEVATASS